MGVVGLTGHFLVATAAPEAWVREHLAQGELLGPLGPAFLTALSQELDRRDDGVDIVLVAEGRGGPAELTEIAYADHPRASLAAAHRTEVHAYETPSSDTVLVLGRGLAARLEVAIEVDAAARGRGLGRRALMEARRLLGPDELLFAQAAPGNVASVRALLAAGFRPIGSEVLFFERY
jgi:GNAT superfamily N-acetyltransferase